MPTPATTQAAAPANAVQPSFAEQLASFLREAWGHLLQLDARQVGLNLMISAAVVLLALGAVILLRRLFDHWLHAFARTCATEVAAEDKKTPRAVGVTWALLRLAILAVALGVVANVWGIDPWAWISDGAGAKIARLALIVVLAVALVEVAGFVIRRVIAGFAARSRDGRRSAQLMSLSPLLTGSVQAVLIVVGVLTFLSELGLQIGPLLASAGVVGLAIGFGAQTLVKDFLTGVFLVAEDAVSVGDHVRAGTSSGKVEAMTLRTIRIRDSNGTLHILPYSEAQVIHNHTKAFSSYLAEYKLGYEADIDRALGVMQQVADELAADPGFASFITKPFELLGVDGLTETAVVVKGRFTTQPKQQWKVGREYNRRVKNAFDAAGVTGPITTVQMVGDAAKPDGAPAAEPRSFAPPDEEAHA